MFNLNPKRVSRQHNGFFCNLIIMVIVIIVIIMIVMEIIIAVSYLII